MDKSKKETELFGEFTVKTGEGRLHLWARISKIGRDVLVSLCGGDEPHIGAVAAAHPRPSLSDPKETGATASVICYTGHKEDQVARRAAITLASKLNTRVVVTAGMHWDSITDAEILEVVKKSEQITEQILAKLTEK